ncbi:MAG TPA: glutaredoxin family protein [Mycobacteriales bacterium]|jgi:hypothetical protein|nr:glutaredoxin family protein [Mycobacteriales bacterium]
MAGSGERVEVVVNPGCHLCEDAVAVIERVCAELGVGWRSTNLADVADAARRGEWREMVPVVLVDGAVHDIFRVDPARLRTALAG